MTAQAGNPSEEPRLLKKLTYGKAAFLTVLFFSIGAALFDAKIAYDYGYPPVPAGHPAKAAAGSFDAVTRGALSFLPMGVLGGLEFGLLVVGPLAALYNFLTRRPPPALQNARNTEEE